MKRSALWMLFVLGCAPPSTVSLGEARHVEVFIDAEQFNATQLTVRIRDRDECLQLSDSARVTFDDQVLRADSPGGPIETQNYEYPCLNASYEMWLYEPSDLDAAHVVTIEDDGHQVLVELPHYLLRPTLTLSETTLHVGDSVTATWSPSDIELCGGANSGFCRLDFYQTTYDWSSYAASAPMHMSGSGFTFVVPDGLDADAGSTQMTLLNLYHSSPANLDIYEFPRGWPKTPISRCEGAETCIATPPFYPAPVDVIIEPADGGG